jgi:polyphosphate kinase
MRVLECQTFRVTRDADIEIEEDEAGDLLKRSGSSFAAAASAVLV